MNLKSHLTVFLLLFITQAFSQNLTQTIRGIVLDKDSRRPLEAATIFIADDSVRLTVISKADGSFLLSNVPVGRRQIQCSFIGYENYITDNIIITSAKELGLVIEMEQLYRQQEAVEVKAKRNPKQPVNKLSVVSTRSFGAEETSRYAASVNDPSRMAMSFPGVQPVRDARSDIIIRGNSAAGMLWRLEGIDIPNPNHFARKGSSGGGITVFSANMLDNSDFSSGAFAAEYGDALSGVFDMHFRKGNDQKNHFSFGAGLIGLDFSAEGPIEKGRSSFLVNYRYSTLGILNSAGFHLTGERENNTFQDLAFNLNFPSKNNRSVINFWGIGGLSKEDYSEVEDPAEWDEYDDYAIYDFRTDMGAIGIGHSLQLGKKSLLKTSLAYMNQKITFIDDTLNSQKTPYTVNDELYKNKRISIASYFNTKLHSSLVWKTGVFITRANYVFNQSLYDFEAAVYKQDIIDGDGSSWLIQPYTQLNWKLSKKFTFNAGLHVMYLALNRTNSIEPRFSLQYRLNTNHVVSLAAGKHGKILPLGSYFYKAANGSFPNMDLEIMRSNHFVAAWDWLMNKNWRLHLEGYLQQLDNIPIVNDVSRTFWLLNMQDGYANEALVSKGKGKNIGADITLEKFFSKGWFLLTGFSIFNSTYEPLNGESYNTQYNSITNGNVTIGKEWKWKKNKTFTAGSKMLYNGGMPITPILPGSPVNSRDPVLDESKPYSDHVPPYFRMDIRLALRKDKKKASST
ncbi:MAG TPA: TonB-dependent receptor, partial [Chitinophagaceae bacterium]